jgi:transcriptional regulator with XRE-family HTH domain
MTLGDRITELRKQKSWSQNELAKKVEISREIIGRYERNDAMPSIDIAKRMADVFEVSLDYLVGNSEQEIDKATLNRINEINKMTPTDKNLVYQFMDAFIMKVKLQGVMK